MATTIKASDMRTIAAENNKEVLIEQIDPEIESLAKDGVFYWTLKKKYKPYKDEIRRSLHKDGFSFRLEKTLLGEEVYKISWD